MYPSTPYGRAWRAAAVACLALLVAVGHAPVMAQQADPVEVDWDATRRRLERQVEANPSDGRAWRELGDALTRTKRPEEALRAYRRARALGVADETVTLAIGDALKELKRNGEAYREFATLLGSSDADRRLTACQELNYLAPYRHKRLSEPYFGDLYLQTGHQSISSTTYLDTVARLGANLLPNEALQVYGSARVTRDNRSGLVEGFPVEYFENAVVLAGGVRYRPIEDLPLYLLAEAGWARDLIDLGRERNHSDLRAGVSLYQEWFTERSCEPGVRRPMRFVLAVSAESMFRSRYRDTVITTLDVRPGVRLVESPFANLDLSAVGALYADSRADKKLQYTQLGVALAWVPDARTNLKLVLEALRTRFAAGERATNVNLYLVYAAGF